MAVLAIPAVCERLGADDRSALIAQRELSHALREALLETLYASGANLLILPFQDVFGWRDRINMPATVGDTGGG